MVVGGCDIGSTTGKAVVMIDGGCLMNFGKYESAVEEFDKSLDVDPNYEPALENKTAVLKQIKNIT